MAIKYLAIDSVGVSFDIDETRTIEVTAEVLTAASGFTGDIVEYTAIVKDNTGIALPATFVAELRINGTQLVSGAFQPNVYNPATFVLTVPFTVPVTVGSFIVKLTSVDQIIE